MIIGLDCAEPSLVLERWRDELPTLGGLMERGALRPPDVGRPADHRAGVVVHDGEPHARATSASTGSATAPTTPTTALFIANGDRGEGAAPLGLATRSGQALDRARRPGTYPPRPLNGVHGQLLPDARRPRASTPTRRCSRARSSRSSASTSSTARTSAPTTRTTCCAQVYEMTDRRFALADHLLAHEAVGALRDGRDGARPDAPRLLEVHGPRAPQHEPGSPYETRSSTTTATSTGSIGRAARARRRRHGGARRLRPRREADGRRHPHQRVAAPRGLPRDARAEPDGRCRRSARSGVDWVADDRLGRGRLLRAGLPQRARPRAGGHGRARRTTSACATSWRERLAAIPDEHGEPIGTRVFSPEEHLPRGERRRARPDRLLRRPRSGARSARRRRRGRSTPSRTTPAPTTRTTPRTASSIMAGAGSRAGPARRQHLLDIAPTVLELLGIEVPAAMRGRSLLSSSASGGSSRPAAHPSR